MRLRRHHSNQPRLSDQGLEDNMDNPWLPLLTPSFQWTGPKEVLDQFYDAFPHLRAPPEKQFKSVASSIQLSTTSLKSKPYNPSEWHRRAVRLMKVGFPELAVGDEYKALTLLRKYNEGNQFDEISRSVAKTFTSTFKTRLLGQSIDIPTISEMKRRALQLEGEVVTALAQALFLCNCFLDCISMIKQYGGKHAADAVNESEIKRLALAAQDAEDWSCIEAGEYIKDEDLVSHERRRSGTIGPCIYPWVTATYHSRNDTVIKAAQESMSGASKGMCAIQVSTMRNKEPSQPGYLMREARVYGVFATDDVEQGDVILVDRTSISGVNDDQQRCTSCRGKFEKLLHESKCCAAKFCGQHCQDQAHQLYHEPTCQDLSLEETIDLDRDSSSPEKLAWLDMLYRVLACAETKHWLHPLHTPVLRQMTPELYHTRPTLFNFERDIKIVFQMLAHLRVDVYKDHGFDTWVLQTIQSRLKNNTRDYVDEFGHHHCVANLSYAFFNHSCKPNVWVDHDMKGSSTLRVIAREFVRKGKEFFISYLPDDELLLDHETRQDLLRHWTGDFCHCRKCHWERLSSGTQAQNRYLNRGSSPKSGQKRRRRGSDEPREMITALGIRS